MRKFIASDGLILIVLGVICFARMVFYIRYGSPLVDHPIESVVPDPVWASMWGAGGVLTWAGAMRHDGILGALGVGYGVGLHILLAGSFFIGAVAEEFPTAIWDQGMFPLGIAIMTIIAVNRPPKLKGGPHDAPSAGL